VYIIYLCCAYLGNNSFEVKVEAASNDITECPCDDKPSIGMLFFMTFSLSVCPRSYSRNSCSVVLKFGIEFGAQNPELPVQY